MRRLLRNVALGVGLVALVPVAIIAVVAIAGGDDEPVIVSATTTTVAAVATPGVVMVSPECGEAFDAVIDQLDVEEADPRIDALTDQYAAARDDATRERLVDEQIAISDSYAEAHDAVLGVTVSACATADEWMQAARDRPRAVGRRDASFVDDLSLYSSCAVAPDDAPACVDALATGRFVPCSGGDGVCLPPED